MRALAVGAGGQSGDPLQRQRPTFRAATTRVRVDVVAFDDGGEFVDDLRADELIVFEDGRPQDIIGLQLVDVRAGRVFAAAGHAEPPNDEVPVQTDVGGPDTVGSRSAAELGAVVFLVDGLGLAARNERRFSTRWAAELAAREGLAVPHALYRIDSIGQMQQVLPLTNDIDALRRGVIELQALADTDLFQDLRILEPSLQRFDLLKQFCAALAGRNGRTVLVFVSTGVSLMKHGFPDTRVLALQKEMHDAANAANVTFYSIDPSLMYELVGTGIDVSRRRGTAERARAGSLRDELGNSLRNAATSTGGRAFIGWADLDRVIDHIERETSRYYLLTYAPQRPTSDSAYHALKVEVTRSGVSVRSRRGYVADPPAVRQAKRLSGALALPGVTGAFPVDVEVLHDRSTTGEPTQVVGVGVSLEHLQPELLGDGTGVVRAGFHLGVVTMRGDTLLYRTASGSRHFEATTATKAVPEGAERPGEALAHSETLTLPPGDYELKVVVVDEVTRRIGASAVPLTVPPARLP